MAEIKLNENFAAQVDAFRTSAAGLDKVVVNSVSADGLSLPTVDAFQDRLFKLRLLMVEFEQLTKKDAKDMDDLAAKLKAADANGG